MALGIVAAITLIGAELELRVAPTNLAMLYLLGVATISYKWGFGPALMASLLSTLTLDFFFIPPYETFSVKDAWYLITAFVFMLIALAISVLTTAVRAQAFAASRREAHTVALYGLVQSLRCARDEERILQAAAEHIRAVFGMEIAVLLLSETGELEIRQGPPAARLDASVQAAAEHIIRSAIRDGAFHRERSFLVLRTARRTMGAVVLLPADSEPDIKREDDVVLEAMADQVALAIERAQLESDAHDAEILRKTDELQRSLLNSVSHSLRAPLAAILSAINPIVEGDTSEPSQTAELARIAHDEASRLDSLIANLLNLSRLEAGALRPHLEPRDVRDVIGRALREFQNREGRRIQIEVEAGLPLAMLDFALVVNVIVNLLDNATKYSPVGAAVDIDARRAGDEIEIRVADRGCGIPVQERDMIFRRFARGSATESVPGLGLGLPICKGFIEAHKGTLRVEDRDGGGSVFCFTLPISDPRNEARGGALWPSPQTESWS